MKLIKTIRNVRFSILVSALLIFGLGAGAAHAMNVHVENNGGDSTLCGNRSDPCRSISQAILNADVGDRILVGPGRYGDLDGDGILGETGEETGEIDYGCQCMVKVDKRVTILSTHGATSTVVDARFFGLEEGSPIVAVRITANGVVFGRSAHGFTLTGSQRNDGLAIGAATGVIVTGNISSRNAGGFAIGGTGNVIKHNIAVGIDGHGFEINGTAHTVWKNAAMGTGDGFLVHGSGHVLTDNVSTGNNAGFSLFGNANLNHNSAIGNVHVGIRLEPGSQGTVRHCNIFGNGDRISSFSALQYNCGLLNRSGQPIIATGNFWGTASGPGADPADAVCDVDGTTKFEPFAKRLFRIAKPDF
jgi:hypothetical protein